LITAAAAHHRLTWIYPFLDGNGALRDHHAMRVSLAPVQGRLFSSSPCGFNAGQIGMGDAV
jgi:hypothetical protein